MANPKILEDRDPADAEPRESPRPSPAATGPRPGATVGDEARALARWETEGGRVLPAGPKPAARPS